MQELMNHVDFPTHVHGGSFHPLLTDLDDAVITSSQLGRMDTSDYYVVLTLVDLASVRKEVPRRKIWLWEGADWASVKCNLTNTDWDNLLQGNTSPLTAYLIALQARHVPTRKYSSKPNDQVSK